MIMYTHTSIVRIYENSDLRKSFLPYDPTVEADTLFFASTNQAIKQSIKHEHEHEHEHEQQ